MKLNVFHYCQWESSIVQNNQQRHIVTYILSFWKLSSGKVSINEIPQCFLAGNFFFRGFWKLKLRKITHLFILFIMRFLFFFVGVGFFPFRIEIRAFSSFSKIEFSFVFLGLLSFPFIKSVGDFFGFAFDFSFGDSISRFIVGFGSIVGRIWKLASRCN